MQTEDTKPRPPRLDAAQESPTDSTSVRADAAIGVRWSMIALTGRQVIRFGVMLALARLLGPESFGIVAQATAVIAFTAVFLDQGLGAALIQKERLTDRDVGSVFLMNAATAFVLGGMTVASAPLAADFFGTPELTDVVRALAISVAVLSLTMTPQALLGRHLRFRAIAIAEVGGAILGGTAGLTAAVLGAGYWALVVQTVVTDVGVLVGFVAATGRIPVRGSLERLRGLWSFGSRVMVFQVLNYFNRNIDNVLIGRYLGPTQLGLYALSYQTMLLPVTNLGQVSNRVAFPMYSRLQNDRDRMGRHFQAGTKLIALISFPLMGLVIVGAPIGVPLVFGNGWNGAILPMQILAVAGMAQSLGTTTGGVLMACGRSDWLLRWGIGSTPVIVASIIFGLRWGTVGVAATYTLATTALVPLSIWLVGRLVGVGITAFGRALLPVLAATAALLAVGAVVTSALDAGGTPEPLALAVGILFALAAYVAVLRAFWADELIQARNFIGFMRKKGTQTKETGGPQRYWVP